MSVISPSILSANFASLGDECRDVLSGGADWIHFDVMDGVFVPNITIGIPVLKSLSKSVKAFYDVHLMINEPIKYVQQFADAGASMITFHVEAEGDVFRTLELIKEKGIKGGIAVRPGTPAEDILQYVDKCDMILLMTVEPGFGGQKFKAEVCPKIEKVRKYADTIGKEDLLIQVDGGIDSVTAEYVARAGADVMVAGSSIFGKDDRENAIREIRKTVDAFYREKRNES